MRITKLIYRWSYFCISVGNILSTCFVLGYQRIMWINTFWEGKNLFQLKILWKWKMFLAAEFYEYMQHINRLIFLNYNYFH